MLKETSKETNSSKMRPLDFVCFLQIFWNIKKMWVDVFFILNIFVTQNLSVVAIFGLFGKMQSRLTKHLIICGLHENENARLL